MARMANDVPAADFKRETAITRRRRAAQAMGSEEYLAKRREVLRAAATVFREKGFDTATIHDVAGALDTNRATLYYYTAGKDELLREIIRERVFTITVELRRLAEAELSATEKLAKFLPTFMASFETYFPHVFSFISDEDGGESRRMHLGPHLDAAVNEVQERVVQIIEIGIRQGEFRDDVPARLIANAVFGMVDWSHCWLAPRGRHNSVDIGNCIATLLLNGLSGVSNSDAGSRLASTIR
jgi:AcrR family transcriptional regulator